MSKLQLILSGATSLALLAAYVGLTIANHDATAILGAFLGQLGGVALNQGVAKSGAVG